MFIPLHFSLLVMGRAHRIPPSDLRCFLSFSRSLYVSVILWPCMSQKIRRGIQALHAPSSAFYFSIFALQQLPVAAGLPLFPYERILFDGPLSTRGHPLPPKFPNFGTLSADKPPHGLPHLGLFSSSPYPSVLDAMMFQFLVFSRLD